jgi:hypothetical protein
MSLKHNGFKKNFRENVKINKFENKKKARWEKFLKRPFFLRHGGKKQSEGGGGAIPHPPSGGPAAA